ncbi:MAG: endonuclease/exonuclease/phosphatase family protein [Patescibacteria group bacterium]
MKLITLNLWGGVVYEPLIEFIISHAEETDVFCFQEMLFGSHPQVTPVARARENLFDEISLLLPEFTAYKHISPTKHFEHEPIEFAGGQAIFVRKGIKVKDGGGFLCYDEIPYNTDAGGKITGNLQWIDLEINDEVMTIANLHGLWQKDTKKLDTPERLVQSKKIKDFLATKKGRQIICGDFNLLPDGKSIEILEQGMKNLVKEYNIQSTRSKFYQNGPRFADYILVSTNINVVDFKVFQDDVSDHLPLMLDFS